MIIYHVADTPMISYHTNGNINERRKCYCEKEFIYALHTKHYLYVYEFHITKYKDCNESTLPNLLYDPVNIVCIEEY